MTKNALFLLLPLGLYFQSLQAQLLSDSLQAHYKFENNFMDATTYHHDLGVLTGQPVFNQVQAGDSAIYFNGLTALKTNNRFDNSSYTQTAISLWLKSSHVSASNQVCLQGANVGFGVFLEANSGKLMGFFDGSSAGAYLSDSAVTDGNWHHVLIQNDGSTTYMYIDGDLQGSQPEMLSVGSGAADNNLYLGMNTFQKLAYTGYLNEIRIYNRLLTSAEIDSLSSSSIANLGVAHADAYSAQIALYPNPVREELTIELGQVNPQLKLEVLTMSGQIIFRESNAGTNKILLDFPFQPGLYLIRLEIEGQYYSFPLAKK